MPAASLPDLHSPAALQREKPEDHLPTACGTISEHHSRIRTALVLGVDSKEALAANLVHSRTDSRRQRNVRDRFRAAATESVKSCVGQAQQLLHRAGEWETLERRSRSQSPGSLQCDFCRSG